MVSFHMGIILRVRTQKKACSHCAWKIAAGFWNLHFKKRNCTEHRTQKPIPTISTNRKKILTAIEGPHDTARALPYKYPLLPYQVAVYICQETGE